MARRFAILAAAACLLSSTPPSAAQSAADPLLKKIAAIVDRPMFRHAMFGVRIATLDSDSTIFELNAGRLFVPGSTTKIVTTGTALELLGADHRFTTPVYRTGPVTAGTVRGDLVLVASGDPNLSHRIDTDTLRFTRQDHSYGVDGPDGLIPGDPLAVLRSLAKQVKDRGIRRVDGRVRIDASLFAEGDRELGTNAVISPIIVNDNVIDIVVSPGARAGAPAVIEARPATRYLRIVNRMVTGPPDSGSSGGIVSDTVNHDGSRTVTFEGRKRMGGRPGVVTYMVSEPSRFAQFAFQEALVAEGVAVTGRVIRGPSPAYADDRKVAEHRSVPFAEAAKVILKVSQNLHASSMPYILGATLRHDSTPQSGFDLMREQVVKLGLDPEGAVQSDGAGGSALYTPRFMVAFLRAMTKTRSAAAFRRALPILGRDGTLAMILPESPAAGHVFAKTGTSVNSDLLNRGVVVNGKGLAGFIETVSGRQLVFAAYVNNVKLPGNGDVKPIGEALGEIAAAAREAVP